MAGRPNPQAQRCNRRVLARRSAGDCMSAPEYAVRILLAAVSPCIYFVTRAQRGCARDTLRHIVSHSTSNPTQISLATAHHALHLGHWQQSPHMALAVGLTASSRSNWARCTNFIVCRPDPRCDAPAGLSCLATAPTSPRTNRQADPRDVCRSTSDGRHRGAPLPTLDMMRHVVLCETKISACHLALARCSMVFGGPATRARRSNMSLGLTVSMTPPAFA